MRPVLILDCDGVILEFIAPFQRWLEADRGIRMTLTGPTVANSMTRVDNGASVDDSLFPTLLDGFFEHGQFTQNPVPDVAAALGSLAGDMDIVVLTNIPARWRDLRIESLGRHGFDFPIFANDGPKGRRVQELADGRPAVFVDDLTPHHKSAAQHAPDVGRLHMVGDPALGALVPPAPAAHARIDGWRDAETWIRNRLEGRMA